MKVNNNLIKKCNIDMFRKKVLENTIDKNIIKIYLCIGYAILIALLLK